MTILRQFIHALPMLAVMSLVVWGAHQLRQATEARLTLASERIITLEQRNARQAATIVNLGSELARQRAAQQSLQTTQADVRQQHAASQIHKQETRRNDPSFSDWGAQPLPGAARRLHERPALSGADGYRQWLSRRNALPAAASSPTE